MDMTQEEKEDIRFGETVHNPELPRVALDGVSRTCVIQFQEIEIIGLCGLLHGLSDLSFATFEQHMRNTDFEGTSDTALGVWFALAHAMRKLDKVSDVFKEGNQKG